MSKKTMLVLCLSLSIILGSFVLQTSSAAATKEVRVGMVYPLSGPLSPEGVSQRRAHDLAAEDINNAGGIKSMGGARLVLIAGDSEGSAEVGMSQTERLIQREKVVVVLGAYQSGVTYPTTQVSERYRTPYFVPVAIADDITDRGFKYTFRLAPKSSLYARDSIRFIKYMGEKTGKKAGNIGLFYEDSLFGQSVAKEWKKHAADAGMKLLMDLPFQKNTRDLSVPVSKLVSAKPDVVFQISNLSDATVMTKTMYELKLNTMGFIACGAGQSDPQFVVNVGKLSDYQLVIAEWNADLPMKAAQELDKRWNKLYGVSIRPSAAECYSATWVLKDVLERAGSLDKEKIREAFTKTDISSGPAMILPYDRIKFGPDGQNTYAASLIMQIVGGKYYTIWPDKFKSREAVWPIPRWEER